MNNYQKFCKPSLSRALSTMGLDKKFHRAAGTHLYYADSKSGQEMEVLDLLGGYGATLLGHNHPELVKVAMDSYRESLPFNNQFSIRHRPAQLAERLNGIFKEEANSHEDFLFVYCSTGAEAVEIAIEHAEISRIQRLSKIMDEIGFAVSLLERLSDTGLTITDEFSEKLKVSNSVRADELAAAIKAYNHQQFDKKGHFVSLENAFHGKLTSSVQLTYGKAFRAPFSHMGMNVHFVPIATLSENIERLRLETLKFAILPKVKNDQVRLEWVELDGISGLFVEPVQGEGGVRCLTVDDAEALHQAKNIWQCPIIADEVQSGSGRCGSFLAGKAIGLSPDYIILSKALGGGLAKIGLVAIKQSIYAPGFDLIQSSTFGEDEHSAKIALAYVDYLYQEVNDTFGRINALGERLKSRLQEVHQRFPDVVSDVRGRGLLLGVEFKSQALASSAMFRTMSYQQSLGYMISGFLFNQHHIRVAPSASASNVVRLEPNICMTEADIDHVFDAFVDVCQAIQYQDTYYFLRFMLADFHYRAPRTELKDYRGTSNTVVPSTAAQVKVAFINHLISSEWLWQIDPSMEGLPREASDYLMEKMDFDWRSMPLPPMKVKSLQGVDVEFVMYPLFVTSAQIKQMLNNNELERIREAVNERVQTAKNDGCKIAGLGMFTSVVTNNCKSVRVPDIGLTTGNSLTVAMSVEAVVQHLNHSNTHLEKVAVIGAGGNIGAVYSAMVSDLSEQIIMIGSGKNGSRKRLLKSAYSLYQDCWDSLAAKKEVAGVARIVRQHPQVQRWLDGTDALPEQQTSRTMGEVIFNLMATTYQENAPVVLSRSIEHISDCKLIICATNASEAFIDERLIQRNAIICDVSVPHNISQAVIDKRPDITCIRGGIVSTPYQESLHPSARAYLEEGQIYACMAETIVLGFEQYDEHYSYGDLSKEGVVKILEMSKKHGFGLAAIKSQQSM